MVLETIPGIEREELFVVLAKARTDLGICRKIMIISAAEIILSTDNNERAEWTKIYSSMVREQESVVRLAISPAKVKLNLPVFNEKAEKEALQSAGDFAESLGYGREFGEAIVGPHIELTKVIQTQIREQAGYLDIVGSKV